MKGIKVMEIIMRLRERLEETKQLPLWVRPTPGARGAWRGSGGRPLHTTRNRRAATIIIRGGGEKIRITKISWD